MLTLLNAGLLPWLAAASMPLIIHLLTRRARRRVDLPTIKFLERTLARQSSIFRWRHLLLLLLRTLAVAALVLVFLHPTLNSPLAASEADRAGAVLILDVSASMGYSAGGLNSLAAAKSEAIHALQALRSGDKANVVLCGAQPQPLFSEPTRDLESLQNAIRAVQPTEERGNPTAAINVAAEQLAKTNAQAKRLYLFSDFQRTNWADAKFDSIGQDTKIVFSGTDAGARDNIGLSSMRVKPSAPRVGQPIIVACEVFNSTGVGRTVPVTLTLSTGARASQTVALGPYSSATASFPVQFDTAQRVECTATIPGDNFALDDTRRAVIDLRQIASIVLITDEDAQRPPAASFFVARALDPDPVVRTGFRVSAVKPAALNNPVLQAADAVIVCGAPLMPPIQMEALSRYMSGGGTVIWFLTGDRLTEQAQELARHLPTADPLPFKVESVADLTGNGKGYVTLAEARYESPLLRAFKDPSASDLARIHFRRFCVTSEVDRRAETLLKYEDGTAAAVRSGVGSGNLLLVNMSPSPEWSDLAKQEAFLPLLHELLKGLMLREGDVREFTAGGAASATIPPSPSTKTAQIVCNGPQGVVPVVTDQTTGSVVIEKAGKCGFYRLASNGVAAATVAVNSHADESDLRWIDPRELEAPRQKSISYLAGASGQGTSVEDLNKGRPLWPWLLVATMLFLFTEQAIGRLKPRIRTSAR
jgi:hypothetical protein